MNEKKGFFAKILENLDQKMKAKANEGCCCSKVSEGKKECCSSDEQEGKGQECC